MDDDGFVTAEDFYNIMTHRVYWDGISKWWFDRFNDMIWAVLINTVY